MPATERSDPTDTGTGTGTRYEYAAGLESAPGDPFGSIELTIEPDGTARLENRHVGRHRAWTGRIDDAILLRLQAELERAGFPDAPRSLIPACSTMRTLSTERDGHHEVIHLPWHLPEEAAGYAEAFRILDSLTLQMAGDAVHATADTLPPVVTELRQIEG